MGEAKGRNLYQGTSDALYQCHQIRYRSKKHSSEANSVEKEGNHDGPAISDKGYLLPTRGLDQKLLEILMDLHINEPSLFPPSISSEAELSEYYRCYRTWRRTSVLRAHKEKIKENDVMLVNKWGKTANQKTAASQPMIMHYTDFELLKKPFLRYTFSM